MISRYPLGLPRSLASIWRGAAKPPVLQGYKTAPFWQRHRLLWGLVYAVIVAAYGLGVAYTGRSLLLQMAVPLVALAALVVWALPDSDRAPLNWVRTLLFAFIVALLVWPDYLAFAVPGLPWLTAIRIIAIPLALVLLICLSSSSGFRQELGDAVNATPLTWKLLAVFIVLAALSILVSRQIGSSLNKFIIAQLYWTMIFFCAAWTFRRPGRAMLLAYILWGCVVFVCLIGVQEWRLHAIPWAGHVPSFLVVEDPVVQNILSAKSRATTGIYRVQSKFTTPLGLAEFLALTTPFLLYFLLFSRSIILRIAAALTLALMFHTIVRTDSRLGAAGFFTACLMFLLAWAVVRWRHVKESIFGPALTFAYPVVAIGFLVATFVVGRLRAMVWGTGAHQFSTQAREDQIASGIPMIMSRPWGYGMGRGASELGYTNLAGNLTIDTYYLVIGLEFGVIGFFIYFGIFLSQIYYSSVNVLKIKTKEQLLIIPCAIFLANFVIIKSVFAQQENHPLVFAILGVATALIWRINQPSDREIQGRVDKSGMVFTGAAST